MKDDKTWSAWTGAAIAAAGAVHLLIACSAASSASTPSGSGPTGGGGANGAGGTLFGGTGATSSGTGAMFTGTGSFASTTPDGGCSNEVHQGERLPLDMYFIVDKSGSMGENVTGGTKWSAVSGVLTTFLNDPANADIGTGIEFFPYVDPNAPTTCQTDADCTKNGQNYGTCTGIPLFGFCLLCYCSLADSCLTGAYAPVVPLSLPPNHAAVVQAIQGTNPGGGTPTRPALEAGISYAAGWAQQNPGRNTIVVLATDGDPTGCQANAVQDVANTAATGVASGIKTFVIGVGSSLTSLDQVAAAGGTNKAFIIDTNGDVAKQFADALASIYGEAASCDFKVPATTGSGQQINPNQVNVLFSASNSAPPSLVLQSSDGTVQSCATDSGWYYDDPSAPTLIHLCPASCDALKAGGTVTVQLGCKTQTRPPR